MAERKTGTGSGISGVVTVVGGSDYAGTPASQQLKVDSNGAITVTSTSGTSTAANTADAPIAGDGRKTVAAAGTAEALAGSTVVRWVTVTALPSNTQVVAVGRSTVLAAVGSARGFPLQPGQAATIPTTNLNLVFVDSRVNGEGVAFAYGA